MNYISIRNEIKKFAETDNKEFVKAIISYEKEIEDEQILEEMYAFFIQDDRMNLLDDKFQFIYEILSKS